MTHATGRGGALRCISPFTATAPMTRSMPRCRPGGGLLPDQGPIGVFVHHNTLHALQHLPFDEAVPKGAAMLGARAWPEARELARGRGRTDASGLAT